MKQLIRYLSIGLILAFLFATQQALATEFITTVAKGLGGSGYDFGDLSECEGVFDNAGDYTATDVRVFSISSLIGSIPDNTTVTGATSGATGTVRHVNYAEDQAVIDLISGTFSSGENVYDTVGVDQFTIDNAGDLDIVWVCLAYSAGGNLGMGTINTATTDASNYLEYRAAEDHGGVWGDGVRIYTSATGTWLWYTDYTRIVGFEIEAATNTSSTNFGVIDLISADNVTIARNMFKCKNSGTGNCYGIRNRRASAQQAIRNIFYETDSRAMHNDSFSSPATVFVNNTCTDGVTGECINHNDSGTNATCINNLCFSTGNCYDDCDTELTTSGSGGAGDTTGTTGLTELTCTDNFTSCTDPWNVHLKAGADCIDAGTDLTTTYPEANVDIDGFDIHADGGDWDCGADEYVAAVAGSRRIIFVQ